MVGLKAAAPTFTTPSPKKKGKAFKKDKLNSASTPETSNGAVIKKEAVTPKTPKSPNAVAAKKGAASQPKGKKNFGQFGKRNALKAKDDVFSKLVKEEAKKENLSPAFMKRLDKTIARLPENGKKFVLWMVHSVEYKIKFLPIIEEVFKLIKEMKVLPLANGVVPKTKKQKKNEKRAKRKLLMKEKSKSGVSAPASDKSKPRKIDDVSGDAEDDNKVASSNVISKKTKKVKQEKVETSDISLSSLALSAISDTESTPSEKKNKKKKKGGDSAEISFSAGDMETVSPKSISKKRKKNLMEPANLSFSVGDEEYDSSLGLSKKKKKKDLGRKSVAF